MKRRTLAIVFGCCGLLAGCTAFLQGWHGNAVWGDPEACAYVDHHGSGTAPADLGNGIVYAETSAVLFSMGGPASSGLEFSSCETGKRLYIGGFFTPYPDSSARFDRRDALSILEERLLTQKPSQGLQSIASEAVTLGLEPQETSDSGVETCGCAALYPEMLGQKRPYFGRELE